MSKPHWNVRAGVADYGDAGPGSSWTNQVSCSSNLTLQQACAKSASDPNTSYFVYCNEGMDLSNFKEGIFSAGDAFFFDGSPCLGPLRSPLS